MKDATILGDILYFDHENLFFQHGDYLRYRKIDSFSG